MGSAVPRTSPAQEDTAASDAATPPPGKVDATRLELQVSALTAIHELELTPAQITILRSYNSASASGAADASTDATPDGDAASPAPAAPRFVSSSYASALRNLRQALLDPRATKLSESQAKLEQLRDEQKLDPMPPVELTTLSRKQASGMLLTLSTGQVAGYIAQHADEIPDATQTLLDALDQSRQTTLSHADYAKLRDNAADQAAVLLSGVSATRFASVHQRILQWLDRAHAMDDGAYTSDEAQLELDLRRIVGQIDPTLELRYWMLHQVGELLSNPQLSVALNALKTE